MLGASAPGVCPLPRPQPPPSLSRHSDAVRISVVAFVVAPLFCHSRRESAFALIWSLGWKRPSEGAAGTTHLPSSTRRTRLRRITNFHFLRDPPAPKLFFAKNLSKSACQAPTLPNIPVTNSTPITYPQNIVGMLVMLQGVQLKQLVRERPGHQPGLRI